MLILASKHDFDYVHNLSGVDWPINSRENIIADIERSSTDTAFATLLGGEQAERMQGYWLSDRRLVAHLPQGWRSAAAWRIHHINQTLNRIIPIPRSQPLGPWQKGWAWWSLPHSTAMQVADGMAGLLNSGRLRGTNVCDEHVTATLITALHKGPVADYRRAIRWTDGAASPNVLSRADLPMLTQGDAWFARKFDADVDDFFYDAFGEFVTPTSSN